MGTKRKGREVICYERGQSLRRDRRRENQRRVHSATLREQRPPCVPLSPFLRVPAKSEIRHVRKSTACSTPQPAGQFRWRLHRNQNPAVGGYSRRARLPRGLQQVNGEPNVAWAAVPTSKPKLRPVVSRCDTKTFRWLGWQSILFFTLHTKNVRYNEDERKIYAVCNGHLYMAFDLDDRQGTSERTGKK